MTSQQNTKISYKKMVRQFDLMLFQKIGGRSAYQAHLGGQMP